MIGEVDGSDFARLYRERTAEINRLSLSQRVIGMTPDEVKAELIECLWKAWLTFDPDAGLTLGQYWWSIWTNRKSDLLGAYFAQKNPASHQDHYDDLEDLAMMLAPMVSVHDLCPSMDRTERAIWVLLAHGFTGLEVRKLLNVSWRTFYRAIERWKTPEVRALLM